MNRRDLLLLLIGGTAGIAAASALPKLPVTTIAPVAPMTPTAATGFSIDQAFITSYNANVLRLVDGRPSPLLDLADTATESELNAAWDRYAR